MPFPFPTSTLYRWTTNLLNRSAPTDPEKVSGFRAGDPVPPLTMNDIIGSISDWVAWALGAGFKNADALAFFPQGLGTWRASSGVTLTYGVGGINVERVSGSGTSAATASGPHPFGGVLSSVEAFIGSGVVGTDNELTVQLFAGGLQAVYEKTDIDAGDSSTTVSLALVPGSTTMPIDGTDVEVEGPFLMIVFAQPGSSAADEFDFETLTLNFS